MRPSSISFAGLCMALLGCADIVCPDGRVTYDRQSCVCAEGSVESSGADDACVPEVSQPVTLDAGGIDASFASAAAHPYPESDIRADAGRDPDAGAADASR